MILSCRFSPLNAASRRDSEIAGARRRGTGLRYRIARASRKKPQPLTAAIIAYMQAGEERGDAQCAGLRVRCLGSGQKAFFYRYRARDGALREIRLDQAGPLTPVLAHSRAVSHRAW